MRKIETQMIEAINNRKDWKSANTEVYVNDNNCANVYLHGNLIAWVNKDNDLTVFDGGWQTVTTKSRLNALCNEFCLRGECIFQKDFVWYVRKLVGAINGQNVYQTEDFFSGYVFAWGVNPPSFLLPNCIMKTITLTNEEFNRLYQLVDVEYFKLCKRVEKDRPGVSSNIQDYITHDIHTKLTTIRLAP